MTRFFLVVSLLLAYTSIKITHLMPNQRWIAVLLTVAYFSVMLSGMFIYRGNPAIFETGWFHALAWVSSILMAFWATFLILSLFFDIGALISFLAGKLVSSVEFDAEKRNTLMYGARVALLVISGGLGGIGVFQAVRGARVKSTRIPVEMLPSPLEGLRIAQISDLHVGPTLRRGYVQEVVDFTNAEKPDLVFLTGDLADATVASIAEHLAPLGQIRAKYGCYYVTGNHEYYWEAGALIEKMRELGFQPLLNENAIIDVGGCKVAVTGVTDPTGARLPGHAPDMARAAKTAEKVDYKILLAHRPGVCDEAESLGFDLQFSGHTHAGQFFPFSLFIGLAHKYTKGLNRQGKLWVYVNPGTGYWGPANRLGNPSEISLITLGRA